MAQYVKASFYIRKGSAIYEREGYTFVRNGRVFCVHNENKGDKNNPAWIVTDPQTGMSAVTDWEASRKKVVEVFDEKFLTRFIELTEHARYAKAVDEFDAMLSALKHEDAPAEEAADEQVEEHTEVEAPVCVTSACLWFDHEVEGSAQAGKGKHAGMWWVKNTPENRERFNVAA